MNVTIVDNPHELFDALFLHSLPPTPCFCSYFPPGDIFLLSFLLLHPFVFFSPLQLSVSCFLANIFSLFFLSLSLSPIPAS